MTTTEQHLLEPAVTDWQPKPGQRVHVAFDAVVKGPSSSDGTWRVNLAPDQADPGAVFAYVWPEHMTRLPDPEPAWWPPQPGDIGTRDGGTWRCDPDGDVELVRAAGTSDQWLFHDPPGRPVSDLLDQHPTLLARGGKPWPQP